MAAAAAMGKCSTDVLTLLIITLCATASFSDVHAADPDPLADFCVADLSPTAPLLNGYACKPRSNVSVEDFVYYGFRKPGIQVSNLYPNILPQTLNYSNSLLSACCNCVG